MAQTKTKRPAKSKAGPGGRAARPKAKTRVRREQPAPGSSAEARKARSIARLKKDKVPLLPSLPRIEDEGEARVRGKDAVVDRVIALYAVAARGSQASPERLASFVREFDVLPKLSPEERAFWTLARPSQRQLATFSWRWEAVVVLLWSLGFVAKLGRPEKTVDVDVLVDIVRGKGPKRLRAEAALRPTTELLDFADLMYRYHWAVRDAQLRGRPTPARLNPDVLMEWDQAARWLVGYGRQKWDDVTLDT